MINTQQAIEIAMSTLQPAGWSLVGTAHADIGSRHFRRADERLFVIGHAHWLRFILAMPNAGTAGAQLMRHALLMSDEWRMAKLGMDDGKLLLLLLEIPQVGLDRRYCQRAAEAFVFADAILQRYLVGEGSAYGSAAPLASTALPDATPSKALLLGRMRHVPLDIISPATMLSFVPLVEHLGWHLRDRLAANQWWMQLKGAERTFDCFLCFDRIWATYQIPLLTEDRREDGRSPAVQRHLCEYLLRLNDHVYWAKFGVDDGDQVVLSIDMPLAAFNMRSFRLAIRTLTTYVREYFYEVQIMANLGKDRRLIELLVDAAEQENA